MSRIKHVENLIKEGFSEKTLAKFTDKQISDLHNRIISEAGAIVMPPNTNPAQVKKYTDQGFNVKLSTTESKHTFGGKKKEKLSPKQSAKMDTDKDGDIDATDLKNLRNKKVKKAEVKEEKPSAGLTKKEKSAVVKKAKKGGDIGKKGKGFEKVEKAAKKWGAKDPKAVAAAAMWKNVKRKKMNEEAEFDQWLTELVNEHYHPLTTKGEIVKMIQEKLKK